MKSKWKIYQLSEVTEIVSGGTPKSEVLEYWDGDVLWITPKDMGQAKTIFVSNTSRTISRLGLQKSSAKLIPKNSVILSTRAPIGHLIINVQEMATNQGCRGLIPKNNLDTKFLFYFLKSNIKLLNDLGTGTTFKELSRNALEKIKIPVPPIEEQKRIVEILDKAFEGIAQAEANTRRNLINARELFDSYLNQVFTKHDQNWTQEPLGKVCTLQRGYDLPQRLRVEGKFPLVSSSGIIDSHQEAKVKAPGVVTGRSGSIGSLFYVKENFWPLNTVLYVKDFHENDPEFIFYLLKHFNLGKYASGAGVPTLNRNHVHSVLVKKPIFIEEQKNLVKSLNKLQEYQKRLETIYQSKLEAIAELKQSILEKAFTGQLSQ